MLLICFQLQTKRIKNLDNMITQRLAQRFKRLTRSLGLSSVLLMAISPPLKADTIAISIPKSGDFSEIGNQFEAGARLAMKKHGEGHVLFVADDGCDEDLASLAAQDIKSIQPAIVTGMICNVAALSLANELKQDKTPLLIAGARSVRLIKDRDREEWNIWRMSPGDDAPAEAIASYISSNLKDTAFALVDDGTIYGRSLTDTIRLKLNDTGMKPQFADTFRAAQSTQSGMLRRLQRSGVDIAFVAAATTEDLFTIAKNHKSLKIKNRLVVTEQLSSLPFLEDANLVSEGVMIAMQAPYENNQDTRPLVALVAEQGIEPSKALFEGYAAIEVALSALGDKYSVTTENLKTKRHESILGAVEFDSQGKNNHNPYKLYVWRNGSLEPLENSNNL